MAERTRYRTTPKVAKTVVLKGKRYNGTASNPSAFTDISTSKVWYTKQEDEEMTDVVIPDYHARSAQGEIFNNPMSRLFVQEIDPTPTPYYRGMLKSKVQSGVRILQGDVWSGYLPISPADLGSYMYPGLNPEYVAMVDSLKARAVTDAHARASTDEMNIHATAGEGRETVQSITDILKRAFKIFRAVKRWDLKYLRREITFKELSSRYMEARYALRPLVYDAAGIRNAWQKATTDLFQRQTFRGFASDTYEISDQFTSTSWWGATRTVKRVGRIEVQVRAGVLANVKVSDLSIWGLDNVIGAAWELLPFSFIADWFFNIGNTIASWTPRLGINKLSSWVVVKSTATMENTLVSCANLPAMGWNEDSSYYWSGCKTRTEVRVTRTPDPTRSVLPSVNVRLDSLKLADLTLIFKQTFAKGFIK